MIRYSHAMVGVLLFFGVTAPAHADWTLNLGYHNPVGSTAGLNLLWLGNNWAFEFGIGWVDLDNDTHEADAERAAKSNSADDKDKRLSIGGDIDLKYLFRSGGFRPYLQGGLGWGQSSVIGDSNHAQAGVGGGFVGAGIMLGSPKFYVYGAAVASSTEHIGLQAGLGFDI